MDLLKKVNEFLPLITAVIMIVLAYFILRVKEIIRNLLQEFKKEILPEIEKSIDLKLANHKIEDLEKNNYSSGIKIVRRHKKT